MRDNRRFQRGSGTFRCRVCGKMTRETGQGEASVEMCAFDLRLSEAENSLQDGVLTPEEFDAFEADLRKQYHR